MSSLYQIGYMLDMKWLNNKSNLFHQKMPSKEAPPPKPVCLIFRRAHAVVLPASSINKQLITL